MEGEGRRGEAGIKLKKKNCIKLRGEKKKKEKENISGKINGISM